MGKRLGKVTYNASPKFLQNFKIFSKIGESVLLKVENDFERVVQTFDSTGGHPTSVTYYAV